MLFCEKWMKYDNCMGRTLKALAVGLAALLLQSCINADEYQAPIDALNDRVDALEDACDRANANIVSLRVVVEAFDNYDFITGVTELRSGGEVVGYKINFNELQSITIYDGVNGSIPYVGLRQDGLGMYWTVSYSDGKTYDLTDEDGNKIRAISALPLLKIEDGYWYISYDSGKTYSQIGKATGDSSEPMISTVDASQANYVVFKMADGSSLKIPRKSAYEALGSEINALNAKVQAIKTFLDARLDDMVYVTVCETLLDGADTIGTHVELSNGQSCDITDWRGGAIPTIRAEQDSSDHTYYWVVEYCGEHFQWILDADGSKIPASASAADMPVAGVRLKQSDGNFYWTVTAGGTTSFIKDSSGEDIMASSSGAAADSLQYSVFESVTDGADYLVVVLKDGTSIKLPHQYTVQYFLASSGVELTGSSFTTVQTTDTLNFRAVGGTIKDVVAIAEGRVSAKVSLEDSCVAIEKEQGFESGMASLTLIATFAEKNSTNTRIRKFTIN